MLRLLRSVVFFSALSLYLAGCASAPPSSSEGEVSDILVEQHQKQLATISHWNSRGRIAFIDHSQQNRDAASYTWRHQYEPVSSNFRLYHNLRGTLARVEVTDDEATLTDTSGQTFEANSVDSLLALHTGFRVPFELLTNAITGKEPAAFTLRQRFFQDGTLASYRAEVQGNGYYPAVWDVTLERYQQYTLEGQTVRLPQRINLQHEQYEIRIQINQWEVNP